MKRVALYCRVSTDNQTVENQLIQLREVALRNGWEVVNEYCDEGISGAKGRDQRPAFNELLKAANRKQFDLIMSWSVDRLGRSLKHLVSFLEDLRSKDVDLYLHQQGIDTSTPTGKMMFQMLGVFSEFERSIMQERIMAGLERAKANGTKLGRPRVDANVELAIRSLRATGKGMISIGRELGIGTSTVQRVLANPIP